ncbi:MAG: hypothetical protein LQ352_006823 [Teloschistes flavicans]|nr:MAG: hypothetical protein LQ352_006823 [Teloschistes flavicans]
MPKQGQLLKKLVARIGTLAPIDATDEANGIIIRIRNCFARADPQKSNEHEARIALKIAHKLMQEHDIGMADIMADHERSHRARRGGQSTVDLQPAGHGGKFCITAWMVQLIGAMGEFFDCRAYATVSRDNIRITFYGIAEHTSSAATAFESTYNQVQDWSEDKGGVAERNSYCLGVADGLAALAKHEKRNADQLAQTNEERALIAKILEEDKERKQREERLQVLPMVDQAIFMTEEGKPVAVDQEGCEIHANVEFDNIDGLDCDFRFPKTLDPTTSDDSHTRSTEQNEVTSLPEISYAGSDAGKLMTIKSEPASSREEPTALLPEFSASPGTGSSPKHQMPPPFSPIKAAVPTDSGVSRQDATILGKKTIWGSVRQLVTFREQSAAIAEDWLKKNKTRVTKPNKMKRSIKNREAYSDGRQDSKRIRVTAARIDLRENGKDDKNGTDTGEV